MQTINNHINEIQKELKKLHHIAKETRDNFLLKRLNLAKELNDKEKAKAIANIRQAENKCHLWARLSSLRSGRVRQQQIDQVLIPDNWLDADIEDEEKIELSDPKKFDKKWKNDLSKWKTIKVQTEIEFYLRLRNQRHFGQAKSDETLFTTD